MWVFSNGGRMNSETLIAQGVVFIIAWCGAYALMVGFKRAAPAVALLAFVLLATGAALLETDRQRAPTRGEVNQQAMMPAHWVYMAWQREGVECHPFPKVRELMAEALLDSQSTLLPYWGERDCPAIETEAAQRTIAMLDAAFVQARTARTEEPSLIPIEAWQVLLSVALGLLTGVATERLFRPA